MGCLLESPSPEKDLPARRAWEQRWEERKRNNYRGLFTYATLINHNSHKPINSPNLPKNNYSAANISQKPANKPANPVNNGSCTPKNSAISSKNPATNILRSQAESPAFNIDSEPFNQNLLKNLYPLASPLQNQVQSPSTIIFPSLKASNQTSVQNTSNYSVQANYFSSLPNLIQKYETQPIINKLPEKSSAKFTVNYPPVNFDSSSNSDISSRRSSIDSDTVQYRPIINLKAAVSNKSRIYSSERSSSSPNQRRGRGRGRGRGMERGRGRGRGSYSRNAIHSQRTFGIDNKSSDSSFESSSDSSTLSEFIRFILSYSNCKLRPMPELIPNLLEDSSRYSYHFEHAFYIELRAILDKALEEAFLAYKYRLNIRMESDSAFLSPITSKELRFEDEIQMNDIVIIIPNQNDFPTNFKEIKDNNIPWTLGLIKQNEGNSISILLNLSRVSEFKHSRKYIVAIIGNVTSLKRELSVLDNIDHFSLQDQILCPQACELACEDRVIIKLKEILQSKQYNKSQVKAIANSLNSASKISLVQGPPGTGKTTTVVGILSGLYAANKSIKVLVCAQSNAAVDEIASTVLKKGIFDLDGNKRNDISLLRIGEKRQKHELGVEEEVKTAKEIEISIQSIMLNVLVEEKLRNESLSDPTSEIKQIIKKLEELEQRLEKFKKRGNYDLIEKVECEFINLSDILAKLKKERSYYFFKKREYKIEFIKAADVIFCTLSGSGSIIVVQNIDSIDYLIIDEACQSLELSTLIPFQYNPKSVVLIGDPKQLPATTFSETSKINKYDRSFFERMMECNIRPLVLNAQYRMAKEISDFTSKTFYNNQIQCPNSVIYRKIPNWVYPTGLMFFNLETSEEMKEEESLSYYNSSEADFVIKVYTLLRKRTYNTNAHIGIISPYKGQVRYIEDLLYYRFGNSWKKNCEVSSVDGFQGREVDLVILSTVRSERIGFLRDERRMNVAISRAKYGMYAIGNEACLSSNPKWRSLIDYCKELYKYESCRSFEDVRYIFNKPRY